MNADMPIGAIGIGVHDGVGHRFRDGDRDPVVIDREMREHEREARDRDPDERSPDSDTSPDPETAEPAPPGNIQSGGQSG